MSYDIFFVRRDPGQTFEDALDDIEESFTDGDPGELTDADLENWDAIVPRAREILGELDVDDDSDASRELTALGTGVELRLIRGEIEIHGPPERPGRTAGDARLGRPASRVASEGNSAGRETAEGPLDCVIVGGGPAGLSAALMLGRCRRTVLLFDSRKPRNASSRTNRLNASSTSWITHPLSPGRDRATTERQAFLGAAPVAPVGNRSHCGS